MANEFTFDTRPFAAALERAGTAQLEAVRRIAQEEAAGLASRVREAYPRGPTGHLKAGVTWNTNTRGRGLGAWVRSTAPHVHFIESGAPSGPGRGHARNEGPRARSKTPKGTSVIFVPLAIKARERFYARVRALLGAETRVS